MEQRGVRQTRNEFGSGGVSKRDDKIEAMRTVQREFEVGDAAMACLQQRLQNEPDYLTRQRLRQQDMNRCRDRLEATYIIRLFAEFEAALRQYWATIKKTKPQMHDLIDGLAARRRVIADWRDDVHKLRKYRNDLVHHADGLQPVTFSKAVQFAARFLSQLPPEW